MIKVLGFKRLMVLTTLVVVNALLAAAVYMYLQPEITKKERTLRGLRGQVSELRTDIDRLQVEFEQLDDQRSAFEALKQQGFFGKQGRREAELILKEIQEQSGVIKAVAKIDSAKVEDHKDAEKSEHKILISPIKINVEAITDLDVFRYIHLMEEFFPGHISVEKIELEREADISGVVLRGIASGNNPALVKAYVEMAWRTMVPDAVAAEVEAD